MLFVAGENLLPILVALLIGFVTGLWIWKFARKVVVKADPVATDDASMRRPYVDNRAQYPTIPLPTLVPDGPMASEDDDPEVLPSPRPEPEVLARRSIAAGGARASTMDPARSAPPNAQSGGDDLQIMKGVGPRLAGLLRTEGITRYDQIATLTGDDLARLDAHLGAFKGRLVRDRIVEQAAFLAAGDRVGYEREFGRL